VAAVVRAEGGGRNGPSMSTSSKLVKSAASIMEGGFCFSGCSALVRSALRSEQWVACVSEVGA
jgi:hypothetical protein